MARKKRVTTSKKEVHGKKSYNGYKNLIIVLLLFSTLVLGVINIYNFFKFKNDNYQNHIIEGQKIIYTNSLITPYPSVSPKVTPTPVPLVGFCLHVPVLMYHHIQPESNAKQLGQTALTVDSKIFDSQMQYLSQNGYTALFANELINALINRQQLPQKSVVITIDDGYEDNYIYALPILKKYGLKANIMLASGLMDNSNMLSWNEVKSLKSSGLIYFTNHTWSHHSIIRGTQDKISMEIDLGQKQIQDNTGQTVNLFTYPYGEYNLPAENTLKEKGYLGAFTEIPGQYQCDSFLMTLHRTRVGNAPLSYYGI